MMKTTPDSTTEAFYTLTGSRRGVRTGPHGGRGRGRASGDQTWCTFCNTRSHSLDDCWSKDRDLVAGNSADSHPSPLCWHSGESSYRQAECLVKHQVNEAWAGGWKRQMGEESQAQLGERESGPGF